MTYGTRATPSTGQQRPVGTTVTSGYRALSGGTHDAERMWYENRRAIDRAGTRRLRPRLIAGAQMPSPSSATARPGTQRLLSPYTADSASPTSAPGGFTRAPQHLGVRHTVGASKISEIWAMGRRAA